MAFLVSWWLRLELLTLIQMARLFICKIPVWLAAESPATMNYRYFIQLSKIRSSMVKLGLQKSKFHLL